MSFDQNEIAISVKGLSKAYKIFDSPGKRFCYYLFKSNRGRDFWALDDVSFEIRKGESFGIIGKNGSGKSTMLQILAGIIKPTAGTLEIHGKIAALLELGSGFNPESTGYENIYMNAAILGVTKVGIEKKINEIIEFADIGNFINQPVKTYSSGMYVRLAFAVAINVDADIILIDEALAVGDLFFRQKCYAKLNQLKAEGKTIILVTHGMGEVEQFCDRAVLLHKGKQISIGRSQDIVKEYYLLNQEGTIKTEKLETKECREMCHKTTSNFSETIEFAKGWKIRENVFYNLDDSKEVTNGKATYEAIGLFDEEGYAKRVFQQGEVGYFYSRLRLLKDIEVPLWGIVLYDNRNTIVHGKDNLQLYCDVPEIVKKGSEVCILQKIKLLVSCCDFSFEASFGTIPYQVYEERDSYSQEELNMSIERICSRNQAGFFSVIPLKKGMPTQILFHGNCDLEGSSEMKLREEK